MKILIISPPRCGSTSLIKSIRDISGYHMINEPYYIEPVKQKYPLILKDNSVVKMISKQVPHKYGTSADFIKYIVSIKNDYDKIILLNRRNKTNHLESWANLMIKQKQNNDTHMIWYSDDIEKELNHVSYDIDLKHHVDSIYDISDILSIPITFYEDLYGDDRELSLNIIKQWDLDIDELQLNELLNPRNRYRQVGTRENLI